MLLINGACGTKFHDTSSSQDNLKIVTTPLALRTKEIEEYLLYLKKITSYHHPTPLCLKNPINWAIFSVNQNIDMS